MSVESALVRLIGKETNQLDAELGGVLPGDPQGLYWDEEQWEQVREWRSRVSLAQVVRDTRISERVLRKLSAGGSEVRREAPRRTCAMDGCHRVVRLW